MGCVTSHYLFARVSCASRSLPRKGSSRLNLTRCDKRRQSRKGKNAWYSRLEDWYYIFIGDSALPAKKCLAISHRLQLIRRFSLSTTLPHTLEKWSYCQKRRLPRPSPASRLIILLYKENYHRLCSTPIPLSFSISNNQIELAVLL